MPELTSAPSNGSSKQPGPSNGPIKRKRETLFWFRWAHAYISMIAFLLMLFFGATGITLNHQGWTFGIEPSVEMHSGTLPAGWLTDNGNVKFLEISQFLRAEYPIAGEVDDFGTDASVGRISYLGPGSSATVAFELETGRFDLTIERQGIVAAMNELHRGRDAGGTWGWLIDVSGAVLVVISLTGLGLQLFLKRRRRNALIAAGVGVLIAAILTLIAVL